LAARVKSIDLHNGRSLIVGNFDGMPGMDAQGTIKLVANSSTSDAGIKVDEIINTSTGNVSLNGTSATGIGVHLTKDVQTQGGSTSIQGTSNGSATGVWADPPANSGNIAATQGILIEGSSVTGVGVDLNSGSLTSADFSGTPHNFGNGNAIHIKGSTGTDSNTVAGVRLNNTVSNWNSTGKITVEASKGALISTNTAVITQMANANVLLSTDGLGDVSAAKINKFSTVPGDIVIVAGKNLLAGDGTGGQVKTVAGNTIFNNGAGKLLVYSGNASDTGALSGLDTTLGTLVIDGTANQNADTNAAFGTGNGITGSTAKAQAIFREKLSFAAGTLSDATLTKTYGDASTANTGGAATTLLGEAKDALKIQNNTSPTITVGNGVNNMVVTKSVIVDTLMSTLTGGAFSTSNFLNANTTGSYQFVGMSSSKYDVGSGIDVRVDVNPKAATINSTLTNVTYNATVQTQNAAVVSGMVSGESLNVTGLASGRDAGTYTSALQATAGSGTDINNYNITVNNANLVIGKKDATIIGTATNVIYNGETQTQDAAVLSGFIESDVIGGTVAAMGLASGRDAGTYTSNLSATGADASNYNVAVVNKDLVIAAEPVTGDNRDLVIADESVTGDNRDLLIEDEPVRTVGPLVTAFYRPRIAITSIYYRVSFAGGSGAATGVRNQSTNTQLVEQCSVLNPEKCECEDTKIPGVELCFAPTRLVSLKD
jgi:hypothetical protein